jgi:catechol 2,3-dioxygenase-like lactoylglutathione lyase family enzyme
MSATAFVGTVMIDCNDLDTMVGFWKEILDLEEKVRHPGYVWLGRLGEKGPALAFQQVPEPRQGKNRIHLDLATEDPQAFTARVLELGGSKVADHESAGFHWSVLADPEGNVFCVSPAGH